MQKDNDILNAGAKDYEKDLNQVKSTPTPKSKKKH